MELVDQPFAGLLRHIPLVDDLWSCRPHGHTFTEQGSTEFFARNIQFRYDPDLDLSDIHSAQANRNITNGEEDIHRNDRSGSDHNDAVHINRDKLIRSWFDIEDRTPIVGRCWY